MTNEVACSYELPNGWVWTTLRDVATVVTGTTPSKKDASNYGDYMPFVKPPELTDSIVTAAEDSLSAKGVQIARVLPMESVLVSCIGNLGKTGINKVPVAFNQQINALILPSNILSKYGFYYCQTLRGWLNSIASATTVAIVNKSRFEMANMPLPPLAEQHRIVAKIEELFTRLDAGVEALTKIKAQLKRYRQAVLKHAFEGKLTAEWREAHKHELEPASVLLERIKEEGQKTAGGKDRDLPPLDKAGLPKLPEGWVWSSFEELKRAERNAIKAGPFGSSLRKECYTPHGYKVYGQEQVIRQDPFYGDYYVDQTKYLELRSCAVRPGDILISLVGTIGRALILPEGSVEGIINPRLVKMSLKERLVSNEYVKAYIESSSVRDFFTLASHGQTMEILNLGILRTLPIPLPSTAEQQRIADEIERRFSVADQIEKTVDQALKQAARLRQSILKRAFEGKLVPQDPDDEPAEILLDRIREDRARLQAGAKPQRANRKRATTQETRLI